MPQHYSYTKDDGETSSRLLHIVTKAPAPNVYALDLTGLGDNKAQAIADLYEQYKKEVVAPYEKAEKARRKEELQTFDVYLLNAGVSDKAVFKNFKVAGLQEVAQ